MWLYLTKLAISNSVANAYAVASFSHRSPCHQLSSDQILILGPSPLLESTARLLSHARPIHKTLCRTGKGRASSQVLASNCRFTNHSILSFANGVEFLWHCLQGQPSLSLFLVQHRTLFPRTRGLEQRSWRSGLSVSDNVELLSLEASSSMALSLLSR